MYNVGAFFRTADAARHRKAVPVRHHRRGRRSGRSRRRRSGAEETVPWEHAWDAGAAARHAARARVRDRGRRDHASTRSICSTGRRAFRSASSSGTRWTASGRRSRRCATRTCAFPMLGAKHSLNVATAGGVVHLRTIAQVPGAGCGVTHEDVPDPLPRLRMNLDFMPSPVARSIPGCSSATRTSSPTPCWSFRRCWWSACRCFDGEQTDLDLRAALVRVTGRLDVAETRAASDRDAQQRGVPGRRDFRARCSRSGAASSRRARSANRRMRVRRIPRSPTSCARPWRSTWPARRRADADGDLVGIAAPHVSPEGGWQSYRAAYGMLRPGAPGPHLRDSGDVALRRAGEVRADAQERSARRWATRVADRRLVDWLAARGGQARRDGGLLPLLRAHGGVSGDLPAARARART